MRKEIFFFLALTCFCSIALGQYSITSNLPISMINEPESTGGLWKFRFDVQTANQLSVTYTPDTGPWPPNFSNPSGSIGGTSLLTGQMGLLPYLDLILTYSDRLEYGAHIQFLGGPQSELQNGFKLSFAGIIQPANSQGDNHSNTCLFGPPLCYPEARTWSITTSSERVALIFGYRINPRIEFSGQYYYQRYRSGGNFSKYDSSIPATYSTYLGGTGDVTAYSIGASYEVPMGYARLAGQLGISQVRATSDVVSPLLTTQIYLGLSLWFDGNMKQSTTNENKKPSENDSEDSSDSSETE